VLDASFRTQALRAQARELSVAHGVPFHFLECQAPKDLCRKRLHKREHETHVSDGRSAIFDDFCASFEPITELSADEHIVVDTSSPLEANLKSLSKKLPMWPKGLTH
jgi:predicted kinase